MGNKDKQARDSSYASAVEPPAKEAEEPFMVLLAYHPTPHIFRQLVDWSRLQQTLAGRLVIGLFKPRRQLAWGECTAAGIGLNGPSFGGWSWNTRPVSFLGAFARIMSEMCPDAEKLSLTSAF